ncbi:ROK family protein, partial [Ectothiorhodospiraceae bacterium WFHF3C12]|nr:ROK family protein [Ectothiorhodospiraceae bacterium WFHF3C12]
MAEQNHVGIDLGGTKTEIIVLDGHGNSLLRERQRTRDGYAGIIDGVAELLAMAEARLGRRADTVGIGTPGALSPATGRVKNSNSTVLNGAPLKRDLETVLARSIAMANDADCFALSEAVDGAGAGYSTVFGVIVGTGCGGGIVVNGSLLSGPNAIAGEWGHNPLPWPRDEDQPLPPCYCGQRGCIETYLSGPGLAADFERRG